MLTKKAAEATDTPPSNPSWRHSVSIADGDLIYSLVLLQGGFGVLAAFGVVALMGSPVYLAAALVKFAAMVVVAVKVAGGRRWAAITMIVVESASVAGYLLSVLIGLVLPALTTTVNLAGLLTGLAAPVTVICLSARMLMRTGRARPPAHPPGQAADPVAAPADTLASTRPMGPSR